MSETNHVSSHLSYEPANRREPVLEISIGEALRSAAAAWPSRIAVVEGSSDKEARRRWTFEALLAEAETVAHALLMRFRPGEHVAVWASNMPEWVLIEFGAALAGLTLITINPAYLGAELAFALKQSRACGIIVQDTYRNRDLVATVKDVRDTLGVFERSFRCRRGRSSSIPPGQAVCCRW